MYNMTKHTPEQRSNDKSEHMCPYCQKLFMRAEDLNLHVLTRHTSSRIPRQSTPNDTARDNENTAPTS